MKAPLPAFVFTTLAIAGLHAEEPRPEPPAAKQFREHLQAADSDKDGFVTRDELVAEGSKVRPREVAIRSTDAMMAQLDTDKDGKLSAAEVAHGATVTAQKVATKNSVHRAQEFMAALKKFRAERKDALPAKLEELVKLKWIEEKDLKCTMADGSEKPWSYSTENAQAEKAIILYSPGPVDSDGQYLAGLGDGSVVGLTDKELGLEKLPHLKAEIVPGPPPAK